MRHRHRPEPLELLRRAGRRAGSGAVLNVYAHHHLEPELRRGRRGLVVVGLRVASARLVLAQGESSFGPSARPRATPIPPCPVPGGTPRRTVPPEAAHPAISSCLIDRPPPHAGQPE